MWLLERRRLETQLENNSESLHTMKPQEYKRRPDAEIYELRVYIKWKNLANGLYFVLISICENKTKKDLL